MTKPERNTPWPFSSARICTGPILRLHIYDVAQESSKGRRMGVRHRRNARVLELLQGSLRIIGQGAHGQEGGEQDCFNLSLPSVRFLFRLHEGKNP